MAKRFTDTDLFRKKFVRSLSPDLKLFWIYLFHDCNHAGIWEVEIEVANARLGTNIKLNEALTVFDEKIFSFDDGSKWFIPSFVVFQYGELNPKNRAHNSVLNILKNKGLISPLQGYKDKDKDISNTVEGGTGGRTVEEILDILRANQIASERLIMKAQGKGWPVKEFMIQLANVAISEGRSGMMPRELVAYIERIAPNQREYVKPTPAVAKLPANGGKYPMKE